VLELVLTFCFIAAMGGWTAATSLLRVETVLLGGLWLVAGGLAFGVPTGLGYHVALRRSLLRIGALPARWWLQPTSLHGLIPDADRRHVLGWCYAGAAGFFVTIAGCAAVAIGAWRSL